MKITVLFILTISWHRSGIRAQQCGKPEITRIPVYIYRRIEEITVKVNRCLFNDTKHAYSDITENCMTAFKSGIFKDKWRHDNQLRDRGSPVVLEEYITTADRISNKIKLRSGAVCRYNRGFCYDPSETVNYAVVWNVVYKPIQACPTRLEMVFFGFVDIWNIQQGYLKYLVYYNETIDTAFHLKIVQEANCGKKNILITEGNSFIVSQQKLDLYYLSTTSVNIFPLYSKRKISEAIMKNCDLQQYPLDFTNRIGEDYLKDSKNIKTILENYQELITGMKIELKKYSSRIGVSENTKPWNAIHRNLTNLESVVKIKVNKIDDISTKLMNLQRAVGDINKIEDLKKTMMIIQELRVEDRRIIEKIDDEHNALRNLEQKLSNLDIFMRKEKSIHPTRMEFNKELSNVQRDISSKLQVFINKLESLQKENFTNWKNNNSQIQRGIADRYDKSLTKLENQFENLSALLENVTNQLYLKINATNKFLINNFTFIKNNLAKIENDIPEIQSLLAKYHEIDNKIVNIQNDLQNHKNKFSNIMKLGEMYIRNIQTNVSSVLLISLNNKYNISEMKNRFDKLLNKLSDIDWNTVKALKPHSISVEECRKEIIEFEPQYDRKLQILGNNLTLALKQYEISWSLQYSDLKSEIRENTDSLLADMTRNNSENTKDLLDLLKKRIDSELTDIKQSVLNNFTILRVDLNDMKYNISNNSKLIIEWVNGTRSDILNMKTVLSKWKHDPVGTVRVGEDKLKDIQKNTTNINNIVVNFGKDISKIKQQMALMNKGLLDVENNLNEKIIEYFEGTKTPFEDVINRTNVQLTLIKQLTFKNLSLMESELKAIQQDILVNYEPILTRVDAIDIAVEKLNQEFKKHENSSILNLKEGKNDLKKIRDIVIETKKRLINNEGEISELKYDLEDITTKLKGIQEISQEYTLKMKMLNESLKLQEKYISNNFPQLVHLRSVIDEIKSKEIDIEEKIDDFEQAIKQIDKKLLKNIEFSDKISGHATEIDKLKNQVKTLGTNLMNENEDNENVFVVIKKNMSDIFTTLKNKEDDTSDLKTRIQSLFTKFDDNKKLIEESKGECLNYVNSRMKSVTEEITQIHNLILKNGVEIRRVQAQIKEKSSACCEETRKDLNDKDALIKQLTVNLDKVMKQVRSNEGNLAQINKLIQDNLNGTPRSE